MSPSTGRTCLAALAAVSWPLLPAPDLRTGAQVDPSLDRDAPGEFLATYCVRCHGAEEPEGDLDLSELRDASPATAATWAEIARQLRDGNMPPAEEPQPEPSEVARILAWIDSTADVTDAPGATVAPRPALRRLDAREYRNTVRDLLELDTTLFDPARALPPAKYARGRDDGAEALLSADFLAGYMDAAEECLRRAVCAEAAPERRTVTLRAPFMRWGGGLLSELVRRRTDRHEELFTRPTGLYGYLVPDELPDGVPHSGEYRVRVRAAAMGRRHPYWQLQTDPAEPLRMAIVAAPVDGGDLRGRQAREVPLAEFELDDTPREYEARIRLDEGWIPRISFENGPFVLPQLAFLNLRAEHHPELLGRPRDPTIRDLEEVERQEAMEFLEVYRGPRVRIFELEIEGPLVETWPPASHVRLFGPASESRDTADVLRRFAARAFRRPVEARELGPILDLAARRRAEGASVQEATLAGLKAILCSPEFLVLGWPRSDVEPTRPDDFALASRLSYFLWSSMPDEELLRGAARGELRQPGTLRGQALRLLADPRSAAFVEHFTDGWLGLERLGEMPPDPDRFHLYYRASLERSMPRESRAFFAHLLQENLSPALFLDSDFTVADAALARFYGVAGVTGSAFRKVPLPDRRRGGLLGQAAVLTVTANGVDTSPVQRGTWVLENLLGVRLQQPRNVDVVSPDTRGGATLREQLALHREQGDCRTCHVRIDPLGHPLENFDAIGAWRGAYEGSGLPIDASGTATDGTVFRHVGEFKDWLLAREDDFTRCLAEKLLIHATGTALAPGDRPELERIVTRLREAGGGLRDLVLLVVESDAFRRG